MRDLYIRPRGQAPSFRREVTAARDLPSPTAPAELPPPSASAPPPGDHDNAILAILDSSQAGETIAMAYARREATLLRYLAGLPVEDARTLHARLRRAPTTGDAVALAFTRMTGDRRDRLLDFLAGARRRAALAAARR